MTYGIFQRSRLNKVLRLMLYRQAKVFKRKLLYTASFRRMLVAVTGGVIGERREKECELSESRGHGARGDS